MFDKEPLLTFKPKPVLIISQFNVKMPTITLRVSAINAITSATGSRANFKAGSTAEISSPSGSKRLDTDSRIEANDSTIPLSSNSLPTVTTSSVPAFFKLSNAGEN